MVFAYVMVLTAAGTSGDLVETIRGIEGVRTAHVVAGDFDIAIEIEAEAVTDLQRTVVDEIQGLDGVGTTRTYIALDG